MLADAPGVPTLPLEFAIIRGMERCFNIAGPCFPDEHYMLPALERLPEAVSLAWRVTLGQPWLVNAIAEECVEVIQV